MKTIITFLAISFATLGIPVENNSCKYSNGRVRTLIDNNWKEIQRKASFTISDKKNFEIRNYRRDGDDLEVNIFSEGYWYDITFTVSFEPYWDMNCRLSGDLLDVYNYKKK